MSTEIYSVFDIANWFIQKGVKIHKKLQKLCYYAQAWNLVFNDKPMIDTDFEAWSHGPVNPQLFDRFKEYGYADINWDELNGTAKEITDENILNILEKVWATYGEYSGFELERLTRSELPWLKAREGYGDTEPSSAKIDNTLMKNYYSSLLVDEGNSSNERRNQSMIKRETLDFDEIFNKNTNVLCEEYSYRDDDGTFNINLSSPLTVLIQTAGRYCESYASDLLYDWKSIEKYIASPPSAGDEKLFVMGFRRNGVDHDKYIQDSDCSGTMYRKVFALKIICIHEENVSYDKLSVTLKDITNDLIGIID